MPLWLGGLWLLMEQKANCGIWQYGAFITMVTRRPTQSGLSGAPRFIGFAPSLMEWVINTYRRTIEQLVLNMNV